MTILASEQTRSLVFGRKTWPVGAWNLWLSIINLSGVLIVGFAPAVVYLIVLAVMGEFNPANFSSNIRVLLTAQALTYLPTALYLAVTLPPIARVPLRELGFVRPTRRALTIAIAGAFAMIVIVDAAASILGQFGPKSEESSVALLRALHTPGDQLSYVLIGVVLAPMVEELSFRVYFLNALTRYMPTSLAIIVSAISFGLMHVFGSPAIQLVTVAIPLTLAGAILAIVYVKARCYWASVLTHALFNGVNTAGVLVLHLH